MMETQSMEAESASEPDVEDTAAMLHDPVASILQCILTHPWEERP